MKPICNKKILFWKGIALMILAAPAVAIGDSARWADEDLKIVRRPSTGVVNFLRSKQGIDSGADNTMLKKEPKRLPVFS